MGVILAPGSDRKRPVPAAEDRDPAIRPAPAPGRAAGSSRAPASPYCPMTAPRLGSLAWLPPADRPRLPGGAGGAGPPELAGPVWVAEIDENLADTAAFTDAYAVPPEASANCVVGAARRAGQTTLAACPRVPAGPAAGAGHPHVAARLVLPPPRAHGNGLVRRHLGARKASFAPQDVAVAETGMAYGGISPVGLPSARPVLVDAAGAAADFVVIGSGIRGSKLAVPGAVLASLPSAEVLDGLGPPGDPAGEPPRAPAHAAPPDRAPDDLDVGWGERPGESDADDRRYLEDRPPHWGSD